MKFRIARVSVHQTSKTIALLSGILGLLAIPVGIQFYLQYPEENLGGAILYWLAPLWGIAFGYLSTALVCWLYNLLANKVGGIEYEVTELLSSKVQMRRTSITATKIKTADPSEIICSNCHTKQWFGRVECEMCGARFE
jgi:hypothetical protein